MEKAIDASLKDLETDYLDLYLMHWPVAFKTGDELFPKDSNGKVQTEDTDFVDVCCDKSSFVHPIRNVANMN